MGSNVPAVIDQRGVTLREEFGTAERSYAAETAIAAVTARERAIVEAQYIVAERRLRKWPDVRVQMMDHCSRPRFAEVSRYKKPVGGKMINGAWKEQFAEGFSIRFAETLAQEMGNVKPESSISFEDDMMRIVRIGVTDLQKNVPWSREVAFAKTVERKGKKGRDGKWSPPEGREVLSERINSYGDPTYLVKATEDEMRAKINAEISKTQRDFLIKLCPRDLLEDWEDAVKATMEKEDKTDPKSALKRWLDRFHSYGVEPSDLEQYFGKKVDAFTGKDLEEMRGLGQALKEGMTFAEAMKAKFDVPEATSQQRDELTEKKIRDLEKPKAETVSRPAKSEEKAAADLARRTEAPKQPEAARFESWQAWQDAKAPDGLARIVIESGENAGTFTWTGDTYAPVLVEQPKHEAPTPTRAKLVFGRKGDQS